MSVKITGWVLLVIGILVMSLASLNVYRTFSKKSAPVNLFNISSPGLDLNQFFPPGVIQPNSQSSRLELIPGKDITLLANLSANTILMGFILSFGFKLASLGIQLLRPIQVKVKSPT